MSGPPQLAEVGLAPQLAAVSAAPQLSAAAPQLTAVPAAPTKGDNGAGPQAIIPKAPAVQKPMSFTQRRQLTSLTVPTQPRAPVQKVGPQSIRRLEPTQTFKDLYEPKELMPTSGSQCRVFSAKCRRTGVDVVVKMRSRRFAKGGEEVWRSLLTRMINLEGHQHVLGLHAVLEDDSAYYLVMERCNGGELFDFLQTEVDVPEKECKRIMRQILQAVDHIHSQGLIHRDIKPENILFHDTTSDPSTPTPLQEQRTVKLIDFDTCQEANSPRAKHVVGTFGYIAPEALKGDYSPASDLWSVGIILYILMTGDMPFDGELFGDDPSDIRCGSSSMEGLYERLKDARIDFECDPWPYFPQARDLCQRLLAFSPGDRSPSARAALNHPWLRG